MHINEVERILRESVSGQENQYETRTHQYAMKIITKSKQHMLVIRNLVTTANLQSSHHV